MFRIIFGRYGIQFWKIFSWNILQSCKLIMTKKKNMVPQRVKRLNKTRYILSPVIYIEIKIYLLLLILFFFNCHYKKIGSNRVLNIQKGK